MDITIFQSIWFVLLFVLLAGYGVLDGFDLGVGFWHLWAPRDQRRAMLDTIRPVWDGNEVWLLTAGGAMFAAFPPVYASVFSGLYLALMLLLVGLIARATAIEYRDKVQTDTWRGFWDGCFAVGSILPALLLGVALGNVLRGLPLNESGDYTGTFFTLLNPFALVIGLLGVAILAAHGALYLAMKAPPDLAARAKRWALWACRVALVLFGLAVAATLATQPQLVRNYDRLPALWLVPLAAVLSLSAMAALARGGLPGRAFLASSLSIVCLLAMAAVGLFPNLVPALTNTAWSLTAGNSSSSELTLRIMFILALLGMPMVIGYNIWAYRVWATLGTKGTPHDY